jgi:predicted RND superfamily exporter protein
MSESEIRTTAFTRATVGFIARRPLVSLLLGLVLTLGFVPGLWRVQSDFTHRAYFWDDDPYLADFEAFERRFGNDDSLIVALHSPSGVFDADTVALVQRLTERLWQLPEVIRVDSLSNFNWVHATGDDITIEPLLPAEITPEVIAQRRAVALAHETLPRYLVSADGLTTLLIARIQPAIDRPSDARKIVTEARRVLAEEQRGDHVLHLSGTSAVHFAFEESSEQDVARLIPLLLVMSAAVLALTLRSVAGVLMPLAVVALAVVAAFGTAGYLGIELSPVTLGAPTILIAVCIANVVHVMASFYRSLGRGAARAEAARYSLLKNFQATFLTSLTTAIGFFSFSSADLKPLSGLGTMAGVGTLFEWVATYLVAGSLLFLLPLERGRGSAADIAWGDRVVRRTLDAISRRRVPVLLVTSLVTLGSLWLSLRLEVNSDPIKYFSSHFPVRVANEFIEHNLGGVRGVELVVDSGSEDGVKDPVFLRKVDELQRWIEGQPGVTRVLSVLDVLKATHRSLNGDAPGSYVIADDQETIGQELLVYTMGLPQGMDLNDQISVRNDALRMTVLWTIPTSSESTSAALRIEDRARELGLKAHATGKNTLYDRQNGYVVDSFIDSFASSLILISVILIVAFRSLKMGLFAMIPNVIPNFIGGGLLYLMRQPLDIGTVLVASVALGIAVDDTIHILANYVRMRRAGHSRNDSIKDTLVDTAPALIGTTAVLAAGFGVFAFGSFMPNVYFGVLTASVLTIGLVIDLTFLPAILMRRTDELAAPAPEPRDAPASHLGQ